MKIMVTGGMSMIGRHICGLLEDKNTIDKVPHEECDLTKEIETENRFKQFNPDIVIHAAGYNGGISWNQKYPEIIFQRTTKMAMNVLDCCNKFNVNKVISIISSCAYPDLGDTILSEDMFWQGLPNNSVECHGLSKRILHAYSKQINKQYNRNYICAVVTNSYGPWDSFHPQKTKVVAALIKKFVEAKQENKKFVECWGSGKPLREFMYVKDVASAIVFLLNNDIKDELINIGSGEEITIKQLTELVSNLVGYDGEIKWDTSKIDGQMRKLLDSSKLKSLGYKNSYSIEDGLKETINWYLENKSLADTRLNLCKILSL